MKKMLAVLGILLSVVTPTLAAENPMDVLRAFLERGTDIDERVEVDERTADDFPCGNHFLVRLAKEEDEEVGLGFFLVNRPELEQFSRITDKGEEGEDVRTMLIFLPTSWWKVQLDESKVKPWLQLETDPETRVVLSLSHTDYIKAEKCLSPMEKVEAQAP